MVIMLFAVTDVVARRRSFPFLTVVLAALCLTAPALRTPTSDPASPDVWPKFGYDNLHSGRSPLQGPRNASVHWTFTTGAAVTSSPVLDAAGALYIGSNDGYLYAVNATTGVQLWRLAGGAPVLSSPALAGGVVYFAAGHTITAVNATTGVALWQHLALGPIVAPLLVSSTGVLVAVDTAGWVYGISTASSTPGTPLWQQSLAGGSLASPLMNDNASVVYVCGMATTVTALNVATGATVWQYNAQAAVVYSSPAFADGFLYAITSDGLFIKLDATGAQQLTLQLDSEVQGTTYNASLALSSQANVFIGGSDGDFRAVDRVEGKLLWSYHGSGPFLSSPAVDASDVVYFAASTGVLYAIDGISAKPVFGLELPGDIHSSPAIGLNRMVFIGSDDGRVYAVGELLPKASSSNAAIIGAVSGGLAGVLIIALVLYVYLRRRGGGFGYAHPLDRSELLTSAAYLDGDSEHGARLARGPGGKAKQRMWQGGSGSDHDYRGLIDSPRADDAPIPKTASGGALPAASASPSQASLSPPSSAIAPIATASP